MSTPEVLGRIRLFRELAPEDRKQVALVSRVTLYERGERLFREGDSCSSLITIARGRVKVFKATRQGRDVTLGLFGRGDPVGAVAVFEGIAYPATAVALLPTTCLDTPRGELFKLLESRPSLVLGLLSALSRRLVYATDRLAHEHSRAEVRYARFFVKLAETLAQTPGDQPFVPIVLSRQDLADCMGTTIETAIRVMSRWRKDGIVETRTDGFLLQDLIVLTKLAQG